MRGGKATGIGLLGAMILVALAGTLIGLSAPLASQVMVGRNTLEARDDLEALKVAIAGNPNLIITEGRADFGYVGTVGSVPAQLKDLWLKGSFPSYAFGGSTLVGAGWVGPYVPKTTIEKLLEFDKDPFGQPYTYTSTPFSRASDGAQVAARIQSAGPDGVANTADDLLIDILKGEVFSQVTGVAKRGNKGLEFATITLNIPTNGVVTQRYDVTDSEGNFEFNDVSFGFRSLSIDPKLTYEEGTAKTKGGGSDLEFKVTNFGSSPTTITSIRLTYGPTAWFEEVKFGNAVVFNYTNNGNVRKGSGELVTFSSSQQVDGSGKPNQIVPIRVENETTVAPDVTIKGIGKTERVEVKGFKNAATGSASNVSVSGATFTVDFSDGSSNTFVVP